MNYDVNNNRVDKLPDWDGEYGGFRYKYPEGKKIDSDMTIWYIAANGDWARWCPGSELRKHLHRLYQVNDKVCEVIEL